MWYWKLKSYLNQRFFLKWIFKSKQCVESTHRSKKLFSVYFQLFLISDVNFRSVIICRCTCSNCKVTYYGKTFRHFYTRVGEHMGISNLTRKRRRNVKQSPISHHLLRCNCAINFDGFSILATDCSKFKLLLKGSLLIKRIKPILNRTIKSIPLELFD